MNHKERVFRTLNNEATDRPPFWLGMPVKKAFPGLFSYFRVKTHKDLKTKIGDDIWDVELPYNIKTGTQLYAALDFKKDKNQGNNGLIITGDLCNPPML